MPIWSNSAVLLLIDSIAIAVAQGYMLARTRLVSRPSPILRVTALRDDAIWDSQMLERELNIFRGQREQIPPKLRPHYTPTHRFEILQIMRLRNWSTTKTADRFAVHPNTIRNWLKELQSTGKSSALFTGIIWNRIHDAVRWTVHEIRRLCPEPECGTRTIARHIIRAAVQISRSSVQRILREEPKRQRPARPPMVPPTGEEPNRLLTPKHTNEVWHVDLFEFPILWDQFTVAAVIDGFSRKLLRLKLFKKKPNLNRTVSLVQSAIDSFGKPRFIITDHGSQFKGQFEKAFDGVRVVKGQVRQPSFNGKVERVFRTLRAWLRRSVLPIGIRAIQTRLGHFQAWYNEHRPHAALNGQTPNEIWNDVDLPAPIPIRQAELCDVNVDVIRHSYRGDPHLPIVSVCIERKEAA